MSRPTNQISCLDSAGETSLCYLDISPPTPQAVTRQGPLALLRELLVLPTLGHWNAQHPVVDTSPSGCDSAPCLMWAIQAVRPAKPFGYTNQADLHPAKLLGGSIPLTWFCNYYLGAAGMNLACWGEVPVLVVASSTLFLVAVSPVILRVWDQVGAFVEQITILRGSLFTEESEALGRHYHLVLAWRQCSQHVAASLVLLM